MGKCELCAADRAVSVTSAANTVRSLAMWTALSTELPKVPQSVGIKVHVAVATPRSDIATEFCVATKDAEPRKVNGPCCHDPCLTLR
jgi:DNA gyrase inhibitor GyrI